MQRATLYSTLTIGLVLSLGSPEVGLTGSLYQVLGLILALGSIGSLILGKAGRG